MLTILKLGYRKYWLIWLIKRLFFYCKKQFLNLPLLVIIALSQKNSWDKKDIRLFGERPNSACDNAYHLYIYTRKNHPDIDAYYIIQKDSPDKTKILEYGNIITYNSLEHIKIFFQSTKIFATNFWFVEPVHYLLWRKRFEKRYGKKAYIFLQHGVIYNDLSAMLHKDRLSFDLFVTSAQREREDILQKYGYTDDQVILTGIARFDWLHHAPKKNILYMPTWRSYLHTKSSIAQSVYLKNIKQLLISKRLNQILETHGYTFVFLPHPELREYITDIATTKCVHIAQWHQNIQQHINECDVFITDYSSTFFDAAYMHIPILYRQFDKKSFHTRHYKSWYFEFKKDGFGPVCQDMSKLLDEIEILCKNDMENDNLYITRAEKFFAFNDQNNCKRIIDHIQLSTRQ